MLKKLKSERHKIPLLPTKKTLQGNPNELSNYCKKLLSLGRELSQFRFFSTHQDDILRLTDENIFSKSNYSNGINQQDQLQHSTSSIQRCRKISEPFQGQEYRVEYSHEAKSRNELSVKRGTLIHVMRKDLTGWWYVTSQQGGIEKISGYVPSCNLEKKLDEQTPIKLAKPELYLVVEDYLSSANEKSDLNGSKKRLSVNINDCVEVLSKCVYGFWEVNLIRYNIFS